MATSRAYDVVVIGSGPGGYGAAIRAAQLGKSAAVIERSTVGGICLNWGCIPTKALIRNAEVLSLVQHAKNFGIQVEAYRADFGAGVDRSRTVARKLTKGVEYLLKKNKVELIEGSGRFLRNQEIGVFDGEGAQSGAIKAANTIIATGSHAKALPGTEYDGQRVISSTEAILLRHLPSSMIILGGGAVGVEFAYVFHVYGVDVTIVEMMPQLLPGMDAEIATMLEKSFSRRKIELRIGWKVAGLKHTNGAVTVSISKDNQLDELEADTVLMAVGRGGNVEGLGLEEVGITVERGFIPADEFQRTNVPHIYAIGDVCGPPLLAHAATAEGVVAAEHLAGHEPTPVDKGSMPGCVYCHPQVATLGLSEENAVAAGYDVNVGRCPFKANGRAQAEGDFEGLVKIVSDAKTGTILGTHIIGPSAPELIADAGVLQRMGMAVSDLGHTIHAHPTLAESLMEAALSIDGESINI